MFSAQKWTDKKNLSDGKIRDLIEHLSTRKLGNKNYPADLMGDAYEILLKKFAEKLDELRERMAQNLISSIDFLKQLLEMTKELLEEEKKVEQPQDKRAQARAALTDLFQSIKTDETPIIVEQVVNDIDNEVVNIIRQFNDAFQSVTARREIKKKLRSILWIKYQIKDNDVFEKAYQYIEQYY